MVSIIVTASDEYNCGRDFVSLGNARQDNMNLLLVIRIDALIK